MPPRPLIAVDEFNTVRESCTDAEPVPDGPVSVTPAVSEVAATSPVESVGVVSAVAVSLAAARGDVDIMPKAAAALARSFVRDKHGSRSVPSSVIISASHTWIAEDGRPARDDELRRLVLPALWVFSADGNV